jgi:hypothetical protein
VSTDRDLADAELAGDRSGGLPPAEVIQDLEFAGRQLDAFARNQERQLASTYRVAILADQASRQCLRQRRLTVEHPPNWMRKPLWRGVLNR